MKHLIVGNEMHRRICVICAKYVIGKTLLVESILNHWLNKQEALPNDAPLDIDLINREVNKLKTDLKKSLSDVSNDPACIRRIQDAQINLEND